MPRYKVAVLVVLLAIGQLVHSYVQADLLHEHAPEWAALRQRHMAESGPPPNPRAHVAGGTYFASQMSR